MSEKKFTVVCPSGVGDWSWIYSKLFTVRDSIARWQILDGMPRRTTSYVEIACPGIEAEYVNLSYSNLRQFQVLNEIDGNSWAQVRHTPGMSLLLDANLHLEGGAPLAEWMPDLPTEYHYPLVTTEDARTRGAWLMNDYALQAHPMKDGPSLLFNAASYKGAKAWNAWDRDAWMALLRAAMGRGWRPVAVGGYWDDLTFAICCELGLPSLVGKTDTATWVEVLRLGDACITYSSGINVVRTVLRKPVLALWPHHQNDLRDSWAPPHMKDDESYLSSLWLPFADVWPVAKRHLAVVESALGRSFDTPRDVPLE